MTQHAIITLLMTHSMIIISNISIIGRRPHWASQGARAAAGAWPTPHQSAKSKNERVSFERIALDHSATVATTFAFTPDDNQWRADVAIQQRCRVAAAHAGGMARRLDELAQHGLSTGCWSACACMPKREEYPALGTPLSHTHHTCRGGDQV